MSDFQLQGEIQIDESGLASFEAAAKQSGERAGEALNDGIEKGADGAGKALKDALDKGAKAAEATGKDIGEDIVDGVEVGAKKIPKAVSDQIKKAEAQGRTTGKKLGDEIGAGVEQGTRETIPQALKDSINETRDEASSGGEKLADEFNAGFDQDLLLDDLIKDVLADSDTTAKTEGKEAGDQFTKGVKEGTAGKDPGTDELFKKAQAKAKPEGQTTGRKFGDGLKDGVEEQRDLFASVIEQAKKAADRADLIFDSVTLEFKYPNGGIVPQEELNRLTKLDTELRDAADALDKFGVEAKQAGDEAGGAGKGVTNLKDQSALLDGVVAGLTATLSGSLLNALGNVKNALTGAVTDFAALDQKIRLANGATGEGAPGYKTLKRAVDEVGVEAAATQTEIADLALELTRAGLSADETAAVMPAISRAAEGTGTAFATMASVVGQALNTFDLDVSEAGRVTDVLVQAANSSSTSVEGLGEALKYAAPAAAALGVDMEETTAVIGLLANAGIDASSAGTGLRTMLTRLSLAANGASGESLGLTRGQEKLADAMRILGAEVIDVDGNLKPLDQSLVILKNTMAGLTEGQQVELATALFGEQGATKFLAVVNQSEEEIKSFFGEIRNSKGATDEARQNMLGLQTSIDQLEGGISVLRGTFGKVVGNALKPFIDTLAAALDAINKLPTPIKDLGAAIALLTGAYVAAKVATLAFNRALGNAAFAKAVTEVKGLATAIRNGIVKDFGAAKTAILNFGKALKNVQWGAAIKAIGNIGSALLKMNFNKAAGQAFEFGRALGLVKNKGDLNSLKNAAANVLGLKRQLVYTTDAAGKTTKKIALLAQEGSKIGPIAAKLGTKMGVAGTAVGKAGAAIGAAALACPPLTIALAALAAGVVSYNVIMKETGRVTEAVQPTIDAVGQAASEAGIEFEDLGRQGGPLKEIFNDVGGSIKSFGEKLGEIPIIGGLAKAGWEGLMTVLKNSPVGLAIQGVQSLTGWIKNLYQEASNSQAIIEAGDQMAQFDEITQTTISTAAGLTKELETLGTTGAPEDIARVGQEAAKTATLMTGQINAAKELETKYRELAAAARANNNEELARGYDIMADSASASAKQLEAVRDKMIEAAQATEEGEEALEAYSGEVDAATQELINLQGAASAVDLRLQGAELSLQAVQATAELENQRYETAKGFYKYQLSQLEGIEGAEQQRETIKDKIREIERQQHEAAKAALEQQIELEGQILALNQEQARIKADLDVAQAQISAREAEIELQEAINEGDKANIDLAKSKLALQEQVVDLAENQKTALGELQGLEKQIFNTQSETKREALRTKEATEGWRQAAGGVSREVGNVASNSQNASREWTGLDGSVYKTEQRMRTLADGTREVYNVSTKVEQPLKNAAGATDVMAQATGRASNQIGTLNGNSKTLSQTLIAAAGGATDIAGSSGDIQAIGGVNPAQLADNLRNSAQAAMVLESAADGANTELSSIPNLSAPANDMTTIASGASEIANSDMDGVLSSMSGSCSDIASAMDTASTNASNFYESMKSAAGIPCNKWMGGDVRAGQTYTVNEIGQESFRSRSGRLSLIKKPAWGRWRAPSDGVVIPAGMTARLQEEGAFDRSPGRTVSRSSSSQKDALPGVIGKLQRSVEELVAKDWNVQVRVRNSEGSSALSVLNKMRT